MDKRKAIFPIILETFACSVIVFSLAGWLVGDIAKEAGGLFSLGSAGIRYESLMQIFICSAAIGLVRVFLLSDLRPGCCWTRTGCLSG